MTNRQLLIRIKAAQSAQDIIALLAEGEMFQNATERTRSRWKRAAAKRRKELE